MNIRCPTKPTSGTKSGKIPATSMVLLLGGGPERSRTSDLRFRKPLLNTAEIDPSARNLLAEIALRVLRYVAKPQLHLASGSSLLLMLLPIAETFRCLLERRVGNSTLGLHKSPCRGKAQSKRPAFYSNPTTAAHRVHTFFHAHASFHTAREPLELCHVQQRVACTSFHQ
jgi:hypothetical protein